MTLTRPLPSYPTHAADRQTVSLAGLAVTLLLVVIGLFLVETLRHCDAVQDCVLSGRSACDAPRP